MTDETKRQMEADIATPNIPTEYKDILELQNPQAQQLGESSSDTLFFIEDEIPCPSVTPPNQFAKQPIIIAFRIDKAPEPTEVDHALDMLNAPIPKAIRHITNRVCQYIGNYNKL